ncbi:hypothetical protein [Paraburkholderia lycopersici]|uniref:Uncharacterized protein n=1 Tax=Paraburkholderia lycopersici TaxID=416944 RepID=A0A1G6M1L7_9BURK|nr:hypothetical protein [Paraburkholderia lycopersici]SDC49433.1 hypothetical protein SAMN05421548_107105 [Paraburkholderia lycopersici]
MISIPQAVSLKEIEAAYPTLSSGQTLRLPMSLKFGGGVGVTGSLIQLSAEWSRSVEVPTLRLYGKETAAVAEAVAKEPHSMAAAYFASAIESASGEAITTRDALGDVVARIAAMQSGRFRETMHGRGAFLGSFSRAKNEFLIPLYSRPELGAVRSRDEFITLTSRIIEACAPGAERHMDDATRVTLGTLIYELFRNTDEHATTDEEGRPYSKNLRAVMAKFISYDAKTAATHLGEDDPRLSFFLLHNIANRRTSKKGAEERWQNSQFAFLELTVLDTGPGLARRWFSRRQRGGDKIETMSIAQEVSLVQECFELHATTKSTAGSGAGLSYVLQTLQRLNAYLRLRTGRVCLVQDFSSPKNEASFSAQHWLKEQPELPMTAGACYSIVVPLSKVLL